MRILIADDHDLVRDMIADILQREIGAIVAPAATVDEALAIVAHGQPFDLALLDYQIPGNTDLSGFYAMRKAAPAMRIAILSGVANRAVAEKALAAGATGFLPKTMKPKSLVNAIQFMASGETFVPFDFWASGSTVPEPAKALELTPRELDVLGGLCDGLSNKEIGRRLDLQEVTVKLYVKTLSRKLNAKNRTHAAMLARDLSLLPI